MSSALRVRFVWFKPLDKCGEEAIDLFQCRRFVISLRGDRYEETRILYSTPDGRFIVCHGDDWYDSDIGEFVYEENYGEMEPQAAANTFFEVAGRRGWSLPPSLEPYREFGDNRRYNRWLCEKYDDDGNERPRSEVLPGNGSKATEEEANKTLEDRAITVFLRICLSEGRCPSTKELAEELKCHPKSLAPGRCPRLGHLRDAARREKDEMVRGFRSERTGQLEAYDGR